MFIDRIVEIINKSPNLDHSKFARMVWGNTASAVTKWRRIRNRSKQGKPQNISLTDAVAMANALATDLPSFSWKVYQTVMDEAVSQEQGEKNKNQPMPEPPSLPTGKARK
jgi:hypothetical protein